METIATFIDTKNPLIRAVIISDYDSESPRSWDNTCIFHFKDDRNYNLPQEAESIIDWQFHDKDSEWDDYEWKEDKKKYLKKLNNEYYLFGMYYNNYSSAGPLFLKECDIYDEKMIGVALVKKGETELTGFNCTSQEEAHDIFEGELKTYQQYNEGYTFGVRIEQLQTGTNEDIKETKQEWETIDSCYGFYGSTDEQYKQAIKYIGGDEFNF